MTEDQMVEMFQELAIEEQWTREDEARDSLAELHSGGKELDPWA